MQTCRRSLPRRGSKGDSGGEGRKEQLFGIDPLSQPSSPQPPCFWFGESFIPPIMLCIGAGWEGGCMVSQVVVFLHAFLIKKKKEVYSFTGTGLKFLSFFFFN